MRIYVLLSTMILALTGCGAASGDESLKEAALRLSEGKAVLVDVREPAEWAETGVPAPAVLLSKSSLDSGNSEWRQFLQQNRDTEIMLICRSGNRSGQVAKTLSTQGYKTTNIGGFAKWKKAGLPVRSVP